jgi:predicted phage terminase large subunit-like protein
MDPEAQRADLARSLQVQQTISPAEMESALRPELFTGQVPLVMLMAAWRRFLKIHGTVSPRLKAESYQKWASRTQKEWGLVEHVAHTCRRFDVDMLLIEAKASGLDVIHEMERLYKNERWSVIGVPAPRDKVARALSVQPAFSQEIIYAPRGRDWADLVKNEMAMFPKGRYKDLTDSATHAISWLRKKGLIQRPEEIANVVRARAELKKPPPVLYHA